MNKVHNLIPNFEVLFSPDMRFVTFIFTNLSKQGLKQRLAILNYLPYHHSRSTSIKTYY